MKTVWREYGAIATLLVVAVGGYLYMSRNQVDLLDLSLQTIGGHLLSLVPDGSDRRNVEAALDTLRMRVDEGEVPPEQIERYAASVFNIGTSGRTLAPEEAEMVVRMAYGEQSLLPAPDGSSAAPPPRPKKATAGTELADLAETLQPMMAFFESVRPEAVADTAGGPVVRFYSDGRLRVVIDDRLREKIEQESAAQALMQERAVSWRAHFAEAVEAERLRFEERADRLGELATVWADTLRIKPTATALARLQRLRSLGLVPESHVDSIVIVIEHELESLVRKLPPPPAPPAADRGSDKGNPPPSASSSSGSNTGR